MTTGDQTGSGGDVGQDAGQDAGAPQWPAYESYDPGSPGETQAEAAEHETQPLNYIPPNDAPDPPYGASQQLEPATLAAAGTIATNVVPKIVFAVIGVAVIGGVVAGVGGIIAASGGDVPGFADKPDAQSAEGLSDLLDDIEERTGGTEVFHAVIYPEYASVDLPVDGTTKRYESSYWDGDLSDDGSKGTSSYARFDLADVDAQVMVDAIAEAKTLVDDPDSWYVVIGSGFVSDGQKADPPTISAYASNEYSESVYVEVAFDGEEVRRYVDGEVVEPEDEK